MNPTLFVPLIWLVMVVTVLAIKLRQFHAKGLTFSQGIEQAAAAAQAQRRAPPPKTSGGVLVVIGLIGGVVVAAGLWQFMATTTFIHTAARTRGQIIDFVAIRGSKGGYSYAPRVQYQPSSAGMAVFQTRVSTSRSYWPPVGSTVDVLYNPRPPYHARINCFMDLWFLPIFLSAFGGIFLTVSIFSLAARRKQSLAIPSPTAPPGSGVPPATSPPSGYDFPNIIR